MPAFVRLNSYPKLASLILPEQELSFAPAIVTRLPRYSGELFRGQGSEMTRVLMQSVAEFLEHLHGLSIAGCRRFRAQLTDPVFESAARNHVYESGKAYMGWTSYCSGQQNRFRKVNGRF